MEFEVLLSHSGDRALRFTHLKVMVDPWKCLKEMFKGKREENSHILSIEERKELMKKH